MNAEDLRLKNEGYKGKSCRDSDRIFLLRENEQT